MNVTVVISLLKERISKCKDAELKETLSNNLAMLQKGLSPVNGNSLHCSTQGCTGIDLQGFQICDDCYNKVIDQMNSQPGTDQDKLDWLERRGVSNDEH